MKYVSMKICCLNTRTYIDTHINRKKINITWQYFRHVDLEVSWLNIYVTTLQLRVILFDRYISIVLHLYIVVWIFFANVTWLLTTFFYIIFYSNLFFYFPRILFIHIWFTVNLSCLVYFLSEYVSLCGVWLYAYILIHKDMYTYSHPHVYDCVIVCACLTVYFCLCMWLCVFVYMLAFLFELFWMLALDLVGCIIYH